MALDLNALLGQLTQSANQRAAGYEQQAQIMNAETEAMAKTMQVNQQEAAQVAAQAGAIAQKEAAVLATQQQVGEKAQVILGLNPDNMENQLISSMGEYDFAEGERKRVRQQYEALNRVSILDNPLAYLAAQLQLPQVAARNNELVAMRDSAAQNIQTRQALLAQHKSAVVANTSEQVKQINLEKAANAQRAAEIQLREAAMENSSKLAGRRLQAFQLSDKVFDIESDLINKQLQIGQYMMSLEERREARAERAAAAAERAAKKQGEADELAALNVQFQRVSQFLGLTTPMTAEIWKKMPDPKKRQAWLEAATTGSIGPDLVSSLAFVQQQGNPEAIRRANPGVAQAANGMSAALESYAGQVQRSAMATGQKLKPAEIVDQAQSVYVNEIVASASRPGGGNSLTSARWDSVFNPYKAQHKMLVDEIASNEKHPLATNQYVNMIVTAINTADNKGAPNLTAEQEQRALKAMADAVAKRQVSPETAANDISRYYRYSMAKNRDLYQYDLFNISPQTRYFGQIGTPGMFGKVSDVDLSDPLQVKKALMEQAVAGSSKKFTTGIPAVDVIGNTIGATSGLVYDAIQGIRK
jgi:hypothetical protein